MKIVLIGATGTIGQAVKSLFDNQSDYDVISVGNTSGDYQVDISNLNSIQQLYKKIGNFDALVSTAGQVAFNTLTELTPDEWQVGLQNKLMGQVHLVTEGLKYINEKGSFTLTSGLLSHDPIKYGTSASMVNSAIEGFVRAASIEMPKACRINVVNPTLLEESVPQFGDYFKGFIPVPAAQVAQAYLKSVAGLQTGQTYKVGW